MQIPNTRSKYNSSKSLIEEDVDSSEILTIFESLPGLYLILKPDAPKFTIAAVTNAYAEATKTKREVIIDQGLFEIFPDNPNDPDANGVKNLTSSLMQVIKHKKPHKMAIQKYDIRIPTKDDGTFEVRYWSPLNLPVLDTKGNLIYIIHSVVDVTDLLQIEKREKEASKKAIALQLLFSELLQAQKESDQRKKLLETITANIPDLVYVFDLNYRFTYANKALLEMWGTTEYLGKNLLELGYEPWHAEMHKKEIDQILVNKKPIRGEVPFTHSILGKRIYDYILVPIFNEKNEVIAVAGTTRDITELRRLTQQKDDFIGIASHELKTPVTSIKAYGQVLQTIFLRKGDMKAVTALQKMDAQVNKLTNLIGDLLDVTKVQSGRLEFHEEFFEFNTLVNEIIDEMQLTTERHTLEKKIGKEIKVYGDRERIGQVITNLISNAIKYSPHTDKILITTTNDKQKVMLCVQDFGVGIPKENQQKIFEQFFRISGPNHSTVPGLGLGLYISSEIIKRQKGRIWVESIEGKGSTFCFSLPIKHKHQNVENILVLEEIKHE